MKRTFATWSRRRAFGVRLAGDVYVVHVDVEIVDGPKPTIGREVEIELTPEEARELAGALERASERADEYTRDRRGGRSSWSEATL